MQAEIAPHAAAWDKNHHFPAEQLKGLAALGCYGVAVPTEWDGAGCSSRARWTTGCALAAQPIRAIRPTPGNQRGRDAGGDPEQN